MIRVQAALGAVWGANVLRERVSVIGSGKRGSWAHQFDAAATGQAPVEVDGVHVVNSRDGRRRAWCGEEGGRA